MTTYTVSTTTFPFSDYESLARSQEIFFGCQQLSSGKFNFFT